MCWYVLERYLYCLTNMSHYTPEFQKYSLGLGKKCLTCVLFSPFLKLTSNIILSLLSGLTPTDLETYDQTGNSGPDGLNAEAESIDVRKDFKDEATAINKPKHVLTTFEMEGLWNLLGKLEELPDHKKCVPDGIRDPSALLNDMRVGAHDRDRELTLEQNFLLWSNVCFLSSQLFRLCWSSVLWMTPNCPTLESLLSSGLTGWVKTWRCH